MIGVPKMMPLPTTPGGFACVLADPPWHFTNEATRAAAVRHYTTMPSWQIMLMGVERVTSENAHLYLCTTDTHIFDAGAVMKAWGFRYIQELIWVKARNGKLQMGLGNYFRHSHESILFGVRGKAPALVHDILDVFWDTRGEHSEKPEMLYQMAERMSPGPRLELFARKRRPDWIQWGFEAP